MTTKTSPVQFNVAISVELKAALEAVRVRDGVPFTEQVKRALQMWCEAKGVPIAAARRRGGK
jgi:hypothetical protein